MKRKKKQKQRRPVDEQEKQKQTVWCWGSACSSLKIIVCRWLNIHMLRKLIRQNQARHAKKCNYWLINSDFPQTIPVNRRGSKPHVWIWAKGLVGGKERSRNQFALLTTLPIRRARQIVPDSLIQIHSVHQMSLNSNRKIKQLGCGGKKQTKILCRHQNSCTLRTDHWGRTMQLHLNWDIMYSFD